MGFIQLDLQVCLIKSETRFHVLDVDVSYHVLLGRPWLNKHKLIVPTYHQCVKGRLSQKVIRIATNSTTFDETKTHYVDCQYYDKCAEDGAIIIS